MLKSFGSAVVFIVFCCLPAFADGAQAQGNSRFAQKFQIPGLSAVIVVAEGDFEPRSVGSYTLVVYGGRSRKFPTDDFFTGIVRPRNGSVQSVKFEDVDGDGKRDIVVIVRSAGSGGYVSADAFHYEGRSIDFIGSVSDLDTKTDPIQALRTKLALPAQKRNAPSTD